jgi:3-oxoadipate enol-lactonase
MPVFRPRYQVIRYDQRGHGASAAVDGPCTLDDLGADALGVMDRSGRRRFHVCGISVGGLVAQWLALHAPARVESLVLCNTAARIGSAESWQARIDTVRRSGLAATVGIIADRWFTAGFGRDRPETLEACRRTLMATDPIGYISLCEALRDSDLKSSIGGIRAPALVVAGRHDQSTTIADARFLAEHIAGAQLEILDAAHISNVEVPEAFSRIVADFCA